MNNLLNAGTIPKVKKAVSECNSRKRIRLSLADERAHKNRVTVIRMLEEKLKI